MDTSHNPNYLPLDPPIHAAPGCIVGTSYIEESVLAMPSSMDSMDNALYVLDIGPGYENEHGTKIELPEIDGKKVAVGDILLHSTFHPLPQYFHHGRIIKVLRFQDVYARIESREETNE